MATQFYIGLLTLFGLISCGQNNRSPNRPKSKIKLTFEVTPEDYERKLFYVEWNDTLGLSEGYKGDNLTKRPKEIWCVITNPNKDTLGYYCGLSTAQTFASFQTKDTIVTLKFMVGLNFFTDKFQRYSGREDYERAAREYSQKSDLPILFKPIELNLNADLRKIYEIELNEE